MREVHQEAENEIAKWSDFGTPELHKRHEIRTFYDQDQKREIAYNSTQWPIDRYYNMGKLNNEQYSAAKMFRRDWAVTTMQPYIKSSLNFDFGSGGKDIFAEEQRKARIRYVNALEVMTEKEKMFVTMVVLNETYLNQMCKKSELNSGKPMQYLQDGLEKLADHYGL